MKRALLISMPFGNPNRPSIALGLLKASLVRDGLPCDVSYLNLRFAKRIGIDDYLRTADSIPGYALGDWLFAADLFGEEIPSPQQYFEVAGAPGSALNSSEWARALEIRAEVGPFLDECLTAIRWDDYALVGFTALFQQSLASLALARRVKERYPHVTIVFGGANCEGEMGVAVHRLFPFVDYVCLGEGDLNFPPLARAILSGGPVEDIPGIARRVGGETVRPRERSAPVHDMDALPIPNYDDFVAEHAQIGLRLKEPGFPIETSRGCWWGQKSHCTFCGLNGEGMQFRAKSPERALREFRELRDRYKTNFVMAVDNILSTRYYREMLPGLADLDLDLQIFYEIKTNIRKDQVRLLREAGVAHVQPGIESLNTNILRLMRKGSTVLQNIQFLRWCSEYMVHPTWNMLAGFPGEDPADYARQAEIIPLFTHLPPPTHGRVTPVHLDRFSPLFFDAEAMGVRNIRPEAGYRYVYPFPDEDLADLAYHFSFEYADNRSPGDYLGEIDRQIVLWRRNADTSRLTSVVDGKTLIIYDTRAVATQAEYQLDGRRRAIYEFCDQARTRKEIELWCASLPGEQTDEEGVEQVLAEFVKTKLTLYEDERYLSLAVPVDYQIESLAGRCAQGRQLHVAMRVALNRLFDPRMPTVTSLFAAKLASLSTPYAFA